MASSITKSATATISSLSASSKIGVVENEYLPLHWNKNELLRVSQSAQLLSAAIHYTKGHVLELFKKENIVPLKEIVWPQNLPKIKAPDTDFFELNLRATITPALPSHIVYSLRFIGENYSLTPEEKTSLAYILKENSYEYSFCATEDKDIPVYLEKGLPVLSSKPVSLDILHQYTKELIAQKKLLYGNAHSFIEKSMARLSVEDFVALPFELLQNFESTFRNHDAYFKNKKFSELFLKIKRAEITSGVADYLAYQDFEAYHFNEGNAPLLKELLTIKEKNEYIRYADIKEIPGVKNLISPLQFVLEYNNWDLTHVSLKDIKTHRALLQEKFKNYILSDSEKTPMKMSVPRVVERLVADKGSTSAIKKLSALFDKEYILDLIRQTKKEDKLYQHDNYKSQNMPDLLVWSIENDLAQLENQALPKEQRFEILTRAQEQLVVHLKERQNKLEIESSYSAKDIENLKLEIEKILLKDITRTNDLFNRVNISGNLSLYEALKIELTQSPTPNLCFYALYFIENKWGTREENDNIIKLLEKNLNVIPSGTWQELLKCCVSPKNLNNLSYELADFEKKVRNQLLNNKNQYAYSDYESLDLGETFSHSIAHSPYDLDSDFTQINATNVDKISSQTLLNILNISSDSSTTKEKLRKALQHTTLSEEVLSDWIQNQLSYGYKEKKNKDGAAIDDLAQYVNQHKNHVLKSTQNTSELLSLPLALTRFNLSLSEADLTIFENQWQEILKQVKRYGEVFGVALSAKELMYLSPEKEAQALQELSRTLTQPLSQNLFALYHKIKQYEVKPENLSQSVAQLIELFDKTQKIEDIQLSHSTFKEFVREHLRNEFGAIIDKFPTPWLDANIRAYTQTHELVDTLNFFDLISLEAPREYFVSWAESLDIHSLTALLGDTRAQNLLEEFCDNENQFINIFKNKSLEEKTKLIPILTEQLSASHSPSFIWSLLGPGPQAQSAMENLILKKYPQELFLNPQTISKEARDTTHVSQWPMVSKPYSAVDFYEAIKNISQEYGSFYEFQVKKGSLIPLHKHFEARAPEYIEFLNLLKSDKNCHSAYLWATDPENISMIVSYSDKEKAIKKYVDSDLVIKEIKNVLSTIYTRPVLKNKYNEIPNENAISPEFIRSTKTLISSHLFSSTNAGMLTEDEQEDLIITLTPAQTMEVCQTLYTYAPSFLTSIRSLGTIKDINHHVIYEAKDFMPQNLQEKSLTEPYALLNHLFSPEREFESYLIENTPRPFMVRMASVLNYLENEPSIQNKEAFIDYLNHLKNLKDTTNCFRIGVPEVAKENLPSLSTDSFLEEKIEALKIKYRLDSELSKTMKAVSKTVRPTHKI